MKLSKNKLGVLVGAALSLGVAGQASADVYGLSTLQVDDLVIDVQGLVSGSATTFTFTTDQNANLNGSDDPASGFATCFGFAPGDTASCGTGTPILSGTVQNAPGSTSNRGENDYTKYGSAGDYSSAEAAIVDAALLLIPGRLTTSTNAISESNLDTGVTAAASTSVQSNTNLQWQFRVENGGGFSIDFNAIIDVLTQVTGGDIGLAQANSGLTVNLTDQNGNTMASWAPNGAAGVDTCAVGLVCSSSEAINLNNTRNSAGAPNQISGGGAFSMDVTGLASGDYTLALATTTSTQLVRRPVPVPGTLFLMGAGLLAAARLRRNKSNA